MVRRILRHFRQRLLGLGLKKSAVRGTHTVAPASVRGPSAVIDIAIQHHKRPLRHEPVAAGAPPATGLPGQTARAMYARKASPPHADAWKRSDYVVPLAYGKTRFADLALPDELVHAVAELKFVYATEIQAMTLPHTLAGKDV